MQQEKSSFIEYLKKVFRGDWSSMHNEFIKEDGTIVDGHALEARLIVFRITGKDQSKNTIQQNGASTYLLIDKTTKELISNTKGKLKSPILHGYNEITKRKCVMIDCQ